MLERKSRLLSQIGPFWPSSIAALCFCFSMVFGKPASIFPDRALALRHFIIYKRGLIGIEPALESARARPCGRCPPIHPRGHRYGRSEKKNIALAAWYAPFG